MSIPVLEGRPFAAADSTEAPPVAIISKSMSKYWPNESPVGKRLIIYFGPPEGIHAEIVGVAGDVHSALDARPNDIIYMDFRQGRHVAQLDLVIRSDESTHVTAAAFGRAVRDAVASIDPNQPVYRVRSMRDLLSVSLATRRFLTLLLTLFAVLAGSLAAVGLYGVLAYSVQTRTREIGIRSALGAESRQVSAMVVRKALKWTVIGVATGIAGAFGLTRLISSLLYEVRTGDLSVYAVVSLLLVATAGLAAYIPARRAARIDPMVALRHE